MQQQRQQQQQRWEGDEKGVEWGEGRGLSIIRWNKLDIAMKLSRELRVHRLIDRGRGDATTRHRTTTKVEMKLNTVLQVSFR